MLDSYINDTSLFLNDPTNQFYTPNTLTTLINRARRWIAVRIGYPRVLVTTLTTTGNQETYPITLANTEVAAVPGVASPFGFWGISVEEGNYMVALGRKDFPSFTADDRILNGTLQNYPTKFASYGRGTQTVAYMFPVPAASYAMWWDLACIPINLESDGDTEALPEPWTEVVPFYAAALANLTQKRWADMQALDGRGDKNLLEASAADIPFMRPDWYPEGR